MSTISTSPNKNSEALLEELGIAASPKAASELTSIAAAHRTGEALKHLPANERQALSERYIEQAGTPVSEIAQSIGMSVQEFREAHDAGLRSLRKAPIAA